MSGREAGTFSASARPSEGRLPFRQPGGSGSAVRAVRPGGPVAVRGDGRAGARAGAAGALCSGRCCIFLCVKGSVPLRAGDLLPDPVLYHRQSDILPGVPGHRPAGAGGGEGRPPVFALLLPENVLRLRDDEREKQRADRVLEDNVKSFGKKK